MTTHAGSPLPEPFDWRPGRLVSLWEIMRKLELDKVFNSYDLVPRLWGRIENKKEVWDSPMKDGHGPDVPQIKAQMNELVERFGALRLRIPHKRAVELVGLAAKQATYREIAKQIEFLHRSLVDHFEERLVLLVDPDNAALYEQKEPIFTAAVFKKFRKSQADIEEAGKCLALNRNKAAVFHLMLAMEVALRRLSKKLKINLLNAKGEFEKWSVLVGRIKDKIPGLPLKRQESWTDAHNLLWGVNKAWRNPTMHPADAYSNDEAREAFDAVRGFMNHLASLV